MDFAYVDTSPLVAIAFDEPGGEEMATELAGIERLVSSNLLEAELLATFLREGRGDGFEDYLARIWAPICGIWPVPCFSRTSRKI